MVINSAIIDSFTNCQYLDIPEYMLQNIHSVQ